MSGEPAPRCAQLWGPETEAGKRILEQIAAEQQAGSTDISTAKRRKNRWTSKTSDVLLPVPGIPGVELSANLAAVAALIDPHSATLQLELAQARVLTMTLLSVLATALDAAQPRFAFALPNAS